MQLIQASALKTGLMQEGQNRISLFLCLYILLLLSPHVVSFLTCAPGTYLYKFYNDQPDVCAECQPNSFMPYTDHQQSQCRTCREIKDPDLEILVSSCNKTHDAVIHCVEGYFRWNETCEKCTNCSDHRMLTAQPCSTYENSICCMDENFDAAPNHLDAPKCKERSWFCKRGQYFEVKDLQCLPCPSNTFMPVDFHVRPEWTDAIGCTPCTNCSTTDVQYEGRKCDSMKNTVCCPQPNMTVVDTLDGPVCTGPSSSCGKGRCKQYSTRTGSVRCVLCEDHKKSENVTEDKLDVPDDVSQRQLTSDDHLGYTVVTTVGSNPTTTTFTPLAVAVATTTTTKRASTLQVTTKDYNSINISDESAILPIIIGVLSGLVTLAIGIAVFKLYNHCRFKRHNFQSWTRTPPSYVNGSHVPEPTPQMPLLNYRNFSHLRYQNITGEPIYETVL